MNRIAYIQYTNPAAYPPLEHSSRILADNGWRVLVLGIGVQGIESFRFPAHDNITFRQLPVCAPGWRQKFHYGRFVAWAIFWTLASRSCRVYASDQLSCPVGLLLSFVPGIRVLYHEHDSPTPDGELSRFMRLVLWARTKLARRAALCILPNDRRAEQFTREVGRGVPVARVWNCPSRNEVNTSPLSTTDNILRVIYQGSIVPVRLPATMIEALAMLPERVQLRVIGYETIGHKGYVAQLQALADKLGVAGRVEFVGAVPTRAEMLEHCREGHVGLAFMSKTSADINEQFMTGASNKPFDYLACGLALLVSDLPDWRAFYVDAGCARAVDSDNASSIASALRHLLDHPDELRAMGKSGRQRILAEWNYETQFASVFQQLRGNSVCEAASFEPANPPARATLRDQSTQSHNAKTAVSKL
jgi:glycosyltransferase involved in cell wall biosynthesis